MDTNLRRAAFSYATYGLGLGVADSVAKTTDKVQEITAAAGNAIESSSNFLFRMFPEAVAAGQLTIHEGAFYYQGVSVAHIISVMVGVFTLIFIIGRGFYDISNGILNRKLKKAALEDIDELINWDSKKKKK